MKNRDPIEDKELTIDEITKNINMKHAVEDFLE
jgi:hypothetical protein